MQNRNPKVCEMCRTNVKKKTGGHPNCEEVLNRETMIIGPCQYMRPQLSPLNEKALWITNKIMGILYSGFGDINVAAIETAMRIYNIPEDEQPLIFERVIKLAEEIRKQQGDKDSGAEHDRDKSNS